MSGPAKRAAGRVRGAGLDATTISIRKSDVANLRRAHEARPELAPADLRSDVIALGAEAVVRGGRVEAARAILPVSP